jgi:hypothetical protein
MNSAKMRAEEMAAFLRRRLAPWPWPLTPPLR